MPVMSITVPHRLPQDEALKRIKTAIANAKKQNPEKVQDFEENWDGYIGNLRGKAMRYTVTGTVAVNPDEVIVGANLPLIAVAFQGKIESTLHEMLARLLA
jgi:hypothetical protein